MLLWNSYNIYLHMILLTMSPRPNIEKWLEFWMLKNKKTKKNSKHTTLAIKVNWILFHLFPHLNIVGIQNICYKKSFVTFIPWKYQFSWQWQLWCISHKSRKMELFGKQANLHKRKSEVKPNCIARKKEFLQHYLTLRNQLYLIFVNNFFR